MAERDLGSFRLTRRDALKAAAFGGGIMALGGGAYIAQNGGLNRLTGTPEPDTSKIGFGLEYGARAAEASSRNARNLHGTETPTILPPQPSPRPTEIFVATPTPRASEVPSRTQTSPILRPTEVPTQRPTEIPTVIVTPSPTETPKPKERLALPAEQKGAAVLAFGSDPNWLKESPKLFDRLARMNVNAITLNLPIMVDGAFGSTIYKDHDRLDEQSQTQNGTPRDEHIRAIIQQAKDKKMDVMLRPIIDETNIQTSGKWRGNIAPRNVNEWFRTYTDVMLSYAQLSQDAGIGGLCIGAELESMEVYGPQWLTMIDKIRQVYEGNITYAYNHNAEGYNPRRLVMAQGLDFVGIDAFFALDASPDASVAEIVDAWHRPSGRGKVAPMQVLDDVKAATGKEIIFAEYGAPARDTAFKTPYDDNGQVRVNYDAQKRYYEALYAEGGPWEKTKGGYIWGFGPWDVRDVPNAKQEDSQFNIIGTPAEAIVAAAYAKSK